MRNKVRRGQEKSAAAVSDQELVARAQAGDASAFGELSQRHAAKVYRLSRYLCRGQTEDAEDTYQNALLNAYRHLATFRGEAQFTSWLTRIAVNECLLHWRRVHREKDWVRLDEGRGEDHSLPVDLTDPFADPEEEYARQELKATLQECLAGLRGSFRDALNLQVVEGLAVTEVATRLGLSRSAAKSLVFRARHRLQRCLAEKFCREQQCYWPGGKMVSAQESNRKRKQK